MSIYFKSNGTKLFLTLFFFVKTLSQAMQTKSCYVVNFLRDDLSTQFPDAFM